MLSESVDLKAEKKEFNRKFLSIIMPLFLQYSANVSLS